MNNREQIFSIYYNRGQLTKGRFRMPMRSNSLKRLKFINKLDIMKEKEGKIMIISDFANGLSSIYTQYKAI